jgi:hypothetical protein
MAAFWLELARGPRPHACGGSAPLACSPLALGGLPPPPRYGIGSPAMAARDAADERDRRSRPIDLVANRTYCLRAVANEGVVVLQVRPWEAGGVA